MAARLLLEEACLRRSVRNTSMGSCPAAKLSCRWRCALKKAFRSQRECRCARHEPLASRGSRHFAGAGGDHELPQILRIGVYAQRLTYQTGAPCQLRARVSHVHVGDVGLLAPCNLGSHDAADGVMQEQGLLAQQGRKHTQADCWPVDAKHVPAHHLQRREPTERRVRRAVVVPDRDFEELLQFLRGDQQANCLFGVSQPLQDLLLFLATARRGSHQAIGATRSSSVCRRTAR